MDSHEARSIDSVDADEAKRPFWRVRMFQNSYFLMANSGINVGVGFLFWIFAARIYAPEAVGIGVSLIALASICAAVAGLGLDSAIVRYLGSHPRPRALYTTTIALTTTTCVVAALIALALAKTVLSEFSSVLAGIGSAVQFVLFSVALALSTTALSVFIALRQGRLSFIHNAIAALGRLALVALLAPVIPSLGVFQAWGIAVTAAVALSLGVIIPFTTRGLWAGFAVDRAIIAEVRGFALHGYLVTLLAISTPLILPIILLGYLPPENNAYFYIAYTISSPILVVSQALSTSAFAEGAADRPRFLPRLRRAAIQASILSSLGVAGLVILARPILLLFGPDYAEGRFVLLLLAVAQAGAGVILFYSAYLRVEHRTTELSILNGGWYAGILLGSAALLATTQLGLVGVGIAYVAATYGCGAYAGLRLIRSLRANQRAGM